MRVALLTPGTGNFHCGSCLRDHTLAAALRALGHEVRMVPLYLPHVTDETDAAGGAAVRMGAVRLYLGEKSSLVARAPDWLARALDSPTLLRWAAGRAGATRPADLGGLTVSMLAPDTGAQAVALEELVRDLRAGAPPDAVCLSNALLAGLARRLRAELRAPVVCTLHGEDSFLDSLPDPWRLRAWAALAERARDVDAFVAVSRWYAERMAPRLALPPDRVRVVHNGIALDDLIAAKTPPHPPAIGFLARMTPAKGLGTLVEAFALLRRQPGMDAVRLRIAGACTPADRAYVAGLQQRLAAEGLSGAVDWLPNVDRAAKAAFLRTLTLLSVPATYGEAFGLYVLEALACAVPVVQPRHGAFPEILEAAGGGVLCAPDDPADLARALGELLRDPERARSLGRQGHDVVRARFGSDRMAREVAGVLAEVCGRRGQR